MEPTLPKRVRIQKTKPSFTKEQRAGFGLAIGIGVLAFGTGIFYVANHLASPFDIDYDGPLYVSPSEREAELLVELQKTDTDEDGMMDYDELYVYKTSPYLADTDGDGLLDLDEIELNKDPNCPEGADCNAYVAQGDAESTLPDDLIDSTQQFASSLEEFEFLLNGLSAEQVRQILLQSGGDADAINALSDEELMQAYQEVIGTMQETGQLEALLQESPEQTTTSE